MNIFNIYTIIMLKLDIEERKLLKFQITQTRHHLSILDGKMSKKHAQNIKYTLQCVNNHYTKFEYKGMKTFTVTDYTS